MPHILLERTSTCTCTCSAAGAKGALRPPQSLMAQTAQAAHDLGVGCQGQDILKALACDSRERRESRGACT